MTKKTFKNKKEIMGSVMKELSTKVRGILESYDDAPAAKPARRPMNEMARSATNRAVDPKALANVRDAAQRRKYDMQWAKDVKPLPKLDDYQLLHRYVAALLLFNVDCPQTEADIDKIGIFANYAHKLIDEGSGTIEDIQLLYSKNDKIVARERKGSKRAIKGWRDEATPSADFDFDKEEAPSAPAMNTEPEIVDEPVDEKPYPEFDDVEMDNEPVDDEDENEETPDTDDEDIADEEEEAAAEEAVADGEQIPMEWDSLTDITYEQYYNPAYNKSFSDINDEFLFWDAEKNLIGMEMSIEDRDSGETREFKLWAPSFGKLLEHFDIATEASIQNMSDKFYKVKTLPVNIRFWKAWRKKGIPTDEVEDQLEDNIDDFYFKYLDNANDIDELVKFIQEMNY